MRKLHLGCGDILMEGWINIDLRRELGVDVVRDILRGLPYDDRSVDEVYSENFLEHLPQTEVIWVMNEIRRVLRPGCLATHVIPLAGTDNDWGDPTHLSRWSPNTITYFDWTHRHWKLYQGMIDPWVIEKVEVLPRGRAFKVVMRRPDA